MYVYATTKINTDLFVAQAGNPTSGIHSKSGNVISA